jgi:hypothetical protein
MDRPVGRAHVFLSMPRFLWWLCNAKHLATLDSATCYNSDSCNVCVLKISVAGYEAKNNILEYNSSNELRPGSF